MVCSKSVKGWLPIVELSQVEQGKKRLRASIEELQSTSTNPFYMGGKNSTSITQQLLRKGMTEREDSSIDDN